MTNLSLEGLKWQHRPLWELTAKKDRRKIANETHVQRAGDNVAILYRGVYLGVIGIRTVTLRGLRNGSEAMTFRMNKMLRDNGIEGYTVAISNYNRPAYIRWNDGTYHSDAFESLTFELMDGQWAMTSAPVVAA